MAETGKLIRFGTRESQLALIQTGIVIRELKSFFLDWEMEIIGIKTQGDTSIDTTLSDVGGKELFVKEIEEALFSGVIHLAVHSMKDVPYELPKGLCIVAMTVREDPRDVFISVDGKKFDELEDGARIGTSSARRAIQLKEINPGIDVVPLRGNVSTRIAKMKEHRLDGIVLAAAGIHRLGMGHVITEYFTTDIMVPAIGQGVLAVEACIGGEFNFVPRCINHLDTEIAVRAERAFMKTLGGSCRVPIGAYAEVKGGTMFLIGLVERNGKIKKGKLSGEASQAEDIGMKLALELGGKT
ncbi:MAG: hydroxymethylbilane synthase [Candidatus Atribacteria bacterium]|nr:hydroxymethylbilane synthase [Candidatus Atribacteria bacterium]